MLPYASFEVKTNLSAKTVGIIVAHPDDETLWAGGAMLVHTSWQCFVACLCRKSDEERAERFYSTLKVLNSEGIMGDLDDGTEQEPLAETLVESTILNLLPAKHFDLIITHSPSGEYTKHLRHEETSKAVITLWNTGKITASELWIFAYEDGNKAYYPQAMKKSSIYQILSKEIWLKKYHIITDIYGFEKESWEAQTTPKEEAFWQFSNPIDAKKWLDLALNI